MGPIPQKNAEFVHLAAAVFAADRSVPRAGGGSEWNSRRIQVVVPVRDVAAWNAIADEMAELVGFLTGDTWTIKFYRAASRREKVEPHPTPVARVLLLSGGADSAVGALVSRSRLQLDETHALLSHVGLTTLSPVQRRVASSAERLLPGPCQRHVQVRFGRHAKRVDGGHYADEPSSRSRSLLFLSLGLAEASIDAAPLWIAENGFASLNPPLGPERRGSLSTRTTHPAFLRGLSELLVRVGAHADIENPFASLTKGEMFALAAQLVGSDEASDYLSATHSCGLSGQRAFGLPTNSQCGVCFGCTVRRAAFHAAGLKDQTDYIASRGDVRIESWLRRNSVVRPMRDFVRRGVKSRDVVTMSLPPDYAASDALDLCSRAVVELKGFLG
jgi:hypothetical protein